MRLQKFLAHAGIASRRAAEDLVRAGRVTVGGDVVTDPATDVDETSGVAVDGQPVRGAEARVVLALNKPAGIVSTARDTHGRRTVVDLAAGTTEARLYPVGRLDADATGLLLLTNDGELAEHLMHPRHQVPKTYRVRVRGGPVREPALKQLREGLRLDDGPTAPAEARLAEPGVIELTIREGRKHQVKRMCAAVGHEVVALERVRFGPLELGDLRLGAVRKLSGAEIERLRRAGRKPSRGRKPPRPR